ncbi:hemolysin XhlA family protein [Enterococcus sp.]|uniref:hemolysin XhlA family protein n=1 Tax=Enterococcus sp. TaxID=35783 RepID=UPI002FCA2E46
MEDEKNLWHEVLQRLTKIEENTKNISDVSAKATDAWHKSINNESDINELKENLKWSWRTLAGIGVSVVVMILSKFIN